jgi:nucleotide-binding universal stress UspA family protein
MGQADEVKRRIVVGIDGSDGSKHALRWAATLAGLLGARIDAVTTWELPTGSLLGALPPSFSLAPDVEQLLNETVDAVFGADRPADMRLKVLRGPAAQTLITVAEGALMLVVGNRGLGGFAGVLLGSVSARVAEHASCPVLVVHLSSAEPPRIEAGALRTHAEEANRPAVLGPSALRDDPDELHL